MKKIDAEYDKDKYAKLLECYYKNTGVTLENIQYQEPILATDSICFSQKDDLYLSSVEEFYELQDSILVDVLSKQLSNVGIVVELGCGYGYNFYVLRKAFPGKVWVGGEYSQNAIELAGHLFADYKDVNVSYFNWYDSDWSILENLKEKALIFTRHSIEQLPKAKGIIPTFTKYKDKIAGVVHLEPVYELLDNKSTLGLMRQAYTLMNDYNADLLSALKITEVNVIKTEVDIVGANPLNPTSIVHWEFTGK